MLNSIVLLGLVDADYKFIWVNVGLLVLVLTLKFRTNQI